MNTIKVPYEAIKDIEYKPFTRFIFDQFKLQVENWLEEGILFDVRFNNKAVTDYETGCVFPLLNYSVYHNQKLYATYFYNVYSMDFSEGDVFEYINGKIQDVAEYPKDVREMIYAFTSKILYSLSYIMNYPRSRKQTRISSHKYSREYRLSTRQNRIYLFSDILKYVSDTYIAEGQHHNIQCPCWDVRGHYRHYKSGKVIFVPAYKKGKQRDNAEPKPKEYYV